MNEQNKAWQRPKPSRMRRLVSIAIGRMCQCGKPSDVDQTQWVSCNGERAVMCLACWGRTKAKMVGAIELKIASMKVDGEWPPRFQCGHRNES